MKKSVLIVGLSLLLLLPSGSAWAYPNYGSSDTGLSPEIVTTSSKAPDIIWEEEQTAKIMVSQLPLASYTGQNGVTINSYSSLYTSEEELQKIYAELLNNAHGSEISYLSHINLYPDYPYGNGTAGRWYGYWRNKELAPDRYIEIYGVDSLTFMEIAHTLSHEYGHHFTYYYLNRKEGSTSDLSETGFTKLRNLTSYTELENGSHEWAPEEIAAEDYAQLFGSSTWKKGLDYTDVRDVALSGTGDQPRRISSLANFNVRPQENTVLPYAWEVPNLYSYWVRLSGVTGPKDSTPPSRPFLALTKIEGNTLTLSWTPSTDNLTQDIRYTVVYTNASYPEDPMGIRTTTDSEGRDAVIGSYKSGSTTYSDRILNGKTTIWVNAQDEAGNIVRSNSLELDENNLQASLSALPNRIYGFDHYDTSIAIAKTGWPNGSEIAFLVTGKNFPDALNAAPLAKKYNAPILLTDSILDTKVKNELNRLGVNQVVIVGGIGAVAQIVEDDLNKMGIATRRIFGIDCYATALAVAQELNSTSDQVFIATGENFPDALSAAPIAANLGIPILLTNKTTLPESVQNFIKEHQINKAYVVGGPAVISKEIDSKLPNPVRIYGNSGYDTNSALINKFKANINFQTIFLAKGSKFPDALSGSALASLTHSPILLTDAGFTAPAQSLIEENKTSIKNVKILGGDGALSNEIITELLK
jgi:putative cell wall-binding protein